MRRAFHAPSRSTGGGGVVGYWNGAALALGARARARTAVDICSMPDVAHRCAGRGRYTVKPTPAEILNRVCTREGSSSPVLRPQQ